MPTQILLDIATPRWALPLLQPKRFKGAKGGRSSGKSRFFAGLAVEEMVADPNLRFVCIREMQRSLQFSAKSTIEGEIRRMGVSHLFQVMERQIRRVGGTGVMIFEGMQDHTADSLKSLEDFGRAWVEEAQSLSRRSLELLIPTIRRDDSEIWFSWNPESEDDPVEKLFRDLAGDAYPLQSGSVTGPEFALVHVNYLDNPFCPSTSRNDAARDYATDTDRYEHVWLGGYNLRRFAQVFAGKWVVDEFEPGEDWDGPYHGADFGFSSDPTAAIRFWIYADCIWIEREAWKVGLETDDMAGYWMRYVPGIDGYTVRADSARPETISYLRRNGIPKIVAAPKWAGSVEDGIEFLRKHKRIVIHPRCTNAANEFRLYSYKVDKKTGDVLPDLAEGYDHVPDALRYGCSPLIQQRTRPRFKALPQSTRRVTYGR